MFKIHAFFCHVIRDINKRFWKQESSDSKDFTVPVEKQQFGPKAYGNLEAAGHQVRG